jgi:hypothetical protein
VKKDLIHLPRYFPHYALVFTSANEIKKGPSRAFIPASKHHYPPDIGQGANERMELRACFLTRGLSIGKSRCILNPHKPDINSFMAKFSSSVALSHRRGNLISNLISDLDDLALWLDSAVFFRLHSAFLLFWITLSNQSSNQGLGTVLYCAGLCGPVGTYTTALEINLDKVAGTSVQLMVPSCKL